jgi:hypothetical protein
MSRKNSSDTIGNRTRDVPVCSVVPQPTAPPRAPNSLAHYVILIINASAHHNDLREPIMYPREIMRVNTKQSPFPILYLSPLSGGNEVSGTN